MLTIFNRKELHMTYDMNDRVRVCDILRANDIDYQLKTTNTTASAMGGRRGGNTFGVNMDYAYEYKIYVHKNDYDRALHLIHK